MAAYLGLGTRIGQNHPPSSTPTTSSFLQIQKSTSSVAISSITYMNAREGLGQNKGIRTAPGRVHQLNSH